MRILLAIAFLLLAPASPGAETSPPAQPFPPSLESYGDSGQKNLWAILKVRAAAEPANWIATLIFLCAILHTFLAPKIMHLAHRWRHEHEKRLAGEGLVNDGTERPRDVSFKAEIAHFFGEIEAVFGIWVIPLLLALFAIKGWPATEHYVSHGVVFTEPMFVVVIMTIASSRPVLRAAEQGLGLAAKLLGGSASAWWLSILTFGPLMGSLITEPAAMTISALLLSRRLFAFQPSRKLAYGTVGLLFVNISIGGTLTHFAAPPVLMVAAKWEWGTAHMLTHFGWKAVIAILASNSLYLAIFRRELSDLSTRAAARPGAEGNLLHREDSVPAWVTAVHLSFLAWTVFTAHDPAFFIGGFLIFLAFTEATEQHQNPLALRSAMLVGFFLAGLVIHGGLQGWWIAPVLGQFGETGLMFTAIVLTAFNDNAAITYLASLVPSLTESLKYAVVAGAVTGGGLTVIANAPNPAGQSVLGKYFPDGLSPVSLLLWASIPTAIATLAFMFL